MITEMHKTVWRGVDGGRVRKNGNLDLDVDHGHAKFNGCSNAGGGFYMKMSCMYPYLGMFASSQVGIWKRRGRRKL